MSLTPDQQLQLMQKLQDTLDELDSKHDELQVRIDITLIVILKYFSAPVPASVGICSRGKKK